MRYCGSVTDQSWTRAVLRLDPFSRRGYMNKMLASKDVDGDYDYIFALKRFPRIFTDEYNNKEK